MERISAGSIHTATNAEIARNTLALASQRSVRRISSGLRGARFRQGERGRNRSTDNRPRFNKLVLAGYYEPVVIKTGRCHLNSLISERCGRFQELLK